MRPTAPARPRRLMRALGPIAVLALVSTLAAGCGDDEGGGGGGSDVETLSQEAVDSALISLDNLGPGFVETEEDEDDEDEDDDEGLGCLFSDLDDGPLSRFGNSDDSVSVEAGVEYELDAEIPSPGVLHEVSSSPYVDPDDEDVLEPIADTLEGCTEVDETDDEGNQVRLSVSHDTGVSDERVDEQVTLEADGTTTTQEGFEVAVSFRFSIVRIDNNLSFLGVFTVFEDNGGPLFDSYQQIAIDKLAAVIDGEEPPTTVGPSPA